MQHQPLSQLQKIAESSTGHDRPTMARNERLERWAVLLERDPGERILRQCQLSQDGGRPT